MEAFHLYFSCRVLLSVIWFIGCLPYHLKKLSLAQYTLHIPLSVTEAIKRFLAEFHEVGEDGRKKFKYALQLVELAHRDQISLTIDIDDVGECTAS